MNPAIRGVFALSSATILAMMPWLTDASSYWNLLLLPVIGLAVLATLGKRVSMFADSRRLLELFATGIVVVGIPVFGLAVYAELGPISGVATIGLLAGIGVVGTSAFRMSRSGGGGIPTVVFFVAYALTMLWILTASRPFIDVAMFQEHGSVALGDGINPYSITFPDRYGALSPIFYGSGVSVDGVLQFGFPYLPLGLLVVAPFEWVFSDFRIAHVLALIAAGILMSRLGGGRVSRAAAAGLLLIAPVPYISIYGWTEPLLVVALVSVIYLNDRSSRSTPYAFGLAVALKQYAVLLLPSMLLLRPRPWSARQIGLDLVKASAVVIAVTLPFFLWNPEAFYRSVVKLLFLQPFRFDSIALPALWAEHFGRPNDTVVVLVPLVGVAIVTVAVWFRAPTGSQGFALASSLTLMVAFALSKYAFANYYLVVVALLFSAAALGGGGTPDAEAPVRETSSADAIGSGP
jgi:hypothetical protein